MFVKLPSGLSPTLDVHNEMCISEVKALLVRQTRMAFADPEQLRLIFSGKELKGGVLGDYGLGKESTMHVMMPRHGHAHGHGHRERRGEIGISEASSREEGDRHLERGDRHLERGDRHASSSLHTTSPLPRDTREGEGGEGGQGEDEGEEDEDEDEGEGEGEVQVAPSLIRRPDPRGMDLERFVNFD